MELAPRKEVMVAFSRWIDNAGHVGGLGSNSYGGGLARVGLENHGIEFADAVGVARRRFVENRGVFMQKWLGWV